MNKIVILEWKQKCNCSSGSVQYEIEGGYRQNTPITRNEAVRLVAEGATIRHAVDSAIDCAEDFAPARDYVPGPYLTK